MTLRVKILFLFLCFAVNSNLSSQTFYREYGSPGVNEGAQVIIPSPDGNILVGGYKGDSALIMKLDQLGNIIWSKRLKPAPNDNMIFDLAITPDNYIVGGGNALPVGNNRRDGFYFKMDLNGNLIWAHMVNDSRDVYFESLVPITSTQYILFSNIYNTSASSWPDVVSLRVDASTGNTTWMSPRLDYIGSNSYIDDIYSETIGKGNSIYTCGRIYVAGGDPGGMRVYQSKFDSNGNHIYSKFLVHTYSDYARLYGIDIIYDNDSLVHCYFGDKNGASSNYTPGLIKADTLGNVIWSKDYDITASSMEISQKVVKTSFGYAIFGYTTGSIKDFFIIATDINGNALWHRTYGSSSSDENFRHTITPTMTYAYGYIYFTGRKVNAGNENIIVARTDQSGSIPCSVTNNIVISQTNNPIASTTCPMNLTGDALSYPTASGSTMSTNIPDACSTYSLNIGKDTAICGSFNLTLNANTAGVTSYVWHNGATTSSINVSTIGTYWVMAQFGGCCVKSDTLKITANGTPLNVAQSFTICPDDSVNVGSSYYSIPGTYKDTLTSSAGCDSIITTTISNSLNANITVLNSNPQICLGGSSTISATGANLYTWSPSTGLNSTTGAIVIATPTTNSTYTVIGTTLSGCSDTASISVAVLLPSYAAQSFTICPNDSVNVGSNYYGTPGVYNDTLTTAIGCDSIITTSISTSLSANITVLNTNPQICLGGSSTLATSGANYYFWSPSTGLSSTTGSIVIASPTVNSTYTVIGTTLSGCSDTAIIPIGISTVAFDAGNPKLLCLGDSTQLSVGGNAATYTWTPSNSLSNPNSSSPIAFPTVTTTYTVMGSNSIGCIGVDSQQVVVLLPPSTPTITINANTLSSNYINGNQWYYNNTLISGATSQSYSPTQNGPYHVVVTDTNGCTAVSAVFNYTYNAVQEIDPNIKFSISPNPSYGIFLIDYFSPNQNEMEVVIENISGQVVKMVHINGQSGKKEIELQKIPSGIYFITLKGKKISSTQKIVVE